MLNSKKFTDKWVKIRKKGKPQYIITRGLLVNGLPFF